MLVGVVIADWMRITVDFIVEEAFFEAEMDEIVVTKFTKLIDHSVSVVFGERCMISDALTRAPILDEHGLVVYAGCQAQSHPELHTIWLGQEERSQSQG